MSRPGKIEQSLTLPELEALCERLRQSPDRTLRGIQALAQEYGVEIGINAADTFKSGPFADYLARIQERADLANLVAAANQPESAHQLADAAGGEMAQKLFLFMMKMEKEPDFRNIETRKLAKDLASMIETLRRGDHRLREMEDKFQRQINEAKSKLAELQQPAVVDDAKARTAILAAVDDILNIKPPSKP